MPPDVQFSRPPLVNPNILFSPGLLQPDQIGPQTTEEIPSQEQSLQIQPPPQDVAMSDAVENGAGPDLQPGNGQVEQFSANHKVEAGRDWDMNSAEGMLGTVQESVTHIKKQLAGNETIDKYVDSLIKYAATTANAHPDMDVAGLAEDLATFKQLASQLKTARNQLTEGLSGGAGIADPRKALERILKEHRVFRFEFQQILGDQYGDAGKMGFSERNLRYLQNTFTFGIKHHITKEDFDAVLQLEQQFNDKISDIRNRLREMNQGVVPPPEMPPRIPENLWLKNTIGDTLELSHRTNDQIRDFQDRDYTTSTLRGIVGPLVEKGGFRKVEFTVGAGALIGLGFSEAATAGARVGARLRVIGEINARGKGRPIDVTFRLAGGVEAKIGVKAGTESALPGAKAEARGGAEVSHFTTRSYATLDDLILDASRCKLATSRTFGGAILGGIKAFGHSIGTLGKKVFRWIGRKIGEVKQDTVQYLDSLKNRGIAGWLDKLLAKRANPVIVGERSGWTYRMQGEANASIELTDFATVGGGVSASHERDFKVQSQAFTSVTRVMREVPDKSSLQALMRPGPEGGEVGEIPRCAGETQQEVLENLEAQFSDALQEAEEVESQSAKLFHFTDTVGFARVANKFRTLLLETELAAREGRISREAADRLLARYANPSVKFPPAIYREYFMEGTGVAKPAKIRNSATAKLSFSFFTGWSKGLTSGIDNSILKSVANGAVKEMRHQIGLDTTFQYRFSSEMPAQPGSDPRPWENTVKTTHELAVTASTPTRIIIDAITRTIVNKGERIENQSENLAKDTAKGLAKDIALDTVKGTLTAALPGLLLSSVKTAAIAGVKKWLSDPENILKLVQFAIEHVGDAFDFLCNTVEFIAEHPDLTLQVAASIMGTSSLGAAERNKVIKWNFADGALESVAVHSETKSTMGVNVEPVGVGLGLGFDISYSVTESVKDREYFPNPTLTMLLGKGEEFLFGETGLSPTGSSQPFKNWLSRNAKGVEQMLGTLSDRRNTDIYERALAQVQNNFDLRERLQEAWQAVQNLPQDATLDAKVDAAHELLASMVLAFRFEA